METISAEEFKKRYGAVGLQRFTQPQQQRGGFGNLVKNYFKDTISDAFKGGVQQVKQGARQINSGNPFEGGIKLASGLVSTAFSPTAPITYPINKGVEFAADKISDNPPVQRFANSKPGQAVSRVAEDTADVANIAGAVGAAKVGKTVTTGVKSAITDIGEGAVNAAKNIKVPKMGKVGETIPNAVKDIVPSSERLVNQQVAKALNLNEADLRNIHLSTGNDVGKFMADNSLIGNNLESTKSLVSDFFDQNYKSVRAEIGNVPTQYDTTTLPRFKQAIEQLYTETAKTPGLEKPAGELGNLAKKKTVVLKDVQRVKELMDKHLSLFKNTGDVKEGITKQGLATIRDELKTFIEGEVEKNSGANIRGMNNNVQTSRGILDAIETRSTRGLTNYNLTMRDLGLFAGGSLAGTPLLGAALVFGELILRSPSMRLKIAKWLAKLPEPQQLKIKTQLQAGEVPKEFFDAGFVRKKVPTQKLDE